MYTEPMSSITSETETPTRRKPVVWLINEGGHDYSRAAKFGRLVPLTTGSINPFNVDRMMALIKPRLEVAHADDYLLISGLQILNAVVLAMWLRRFGYANVLQWSIHKQLYVPIFISGRAVDKNALGALTIAD